jgi:hypothetical protein
MQLMAKLNETIFIVKVSELLRDDQTAQPVFDNETIVQIQAVLEELAGAGKLVEIINNEHNPS